jgi:hypothetical protein
MLPHSLIEAIRFCLFLSAMSLHTVAFISAMRVPGIKESKLHLIKLLGWACLATDGLLIIVDPSLHLSSHAAGIWTAGASLVFSYMEYRKWRQR